VSETVGVGEAVFDADTVALGEALRLGVSDPVGDAVVDLLGDQVLVRVREDDGAPGTTEADTLGVAEGEAEGYHGTYAAGVMTGSTVGHTSEGFTQVT
jgi:hypothetical protein